MKPDVPAVLETIATTLITEIVPALPKEYDQKNLMLLTFALLAAKGEWDGAAAWRVEENAALRALFRRGNAMVSDPDLAARLCAAADAPDPGLRISALDAENARLRALVIELQEHLETRTDSPAADLARQVLAELARGSDRRRIDVPIFG
jgi:hypothetical protein